jgi:hypothetical protein
MLNCTKQTVSCDVTGVVTEELLDELAEDINADDCKMIAKHLMVPNNRLQAICSIHVDPSKIAYEILLAWAKGMERSADKVRVTLFCNYLVVIN